MANILTTAFEAFEAELAAFMLLNTSTIPQYFQDENTIKRVSSNNAFLRVTLLPAPSIIETIGPGGITRTQGVIQIDCIYPSDKQAHDARICADLILDHFDYGTVLPHGTGVQFTITNNYGLPASYIDNYYVLPVRFEFASWNYRSV